MHFVVSNERIRQKEVFSQRASEENTDILAMTHLYGAHNMTKQFEFELCKFELLPSVI